MINLSCSAIIAITPDRVKRQIESSAKACLCYDIRRDYGLGEILRNCPQAAWTFEPRLARI